MRAVFSVLIPVSGKCATAGRAGVIVDSSANRMGAPIPCAANVRAELLLLAARRLLYGLSATETAVLVRRGAGYVIPSAEGFYCVFREAQLCGDIREAHAGSPHTCYSGFLFRRHKAHFLHLPTPRNRRFLQPITQKRPVSISEETPTGVKIAQARPQNPGRDNVAALQS